MSEPTKFCVNCRWHRHDSDYRVIYSLRDHRCVHPTVVRQQTRNPVTGDRCYTDTNNGKQFFTPDSYPECSSINHGDCKLFEAK